MLANFFILLEKLFPLWPYHYICGMKIVGFYAVLFLGLALMGCDQDIDLTADWEDIPIVYGLLNEADTAHYIRVEKAFQDQNGNAFFSALEPDSIYYSDVTVKLLNLTTGGFAILQRVDGTAEGYPRDGGDFAQEPNYLYKVHSSDFALNGADQVRFTLERGKGLPDVESECTVLRNLIPQGGLAPGSKINFPENQDVSFRWRAEEEARIFDLNLIIHYDEKVINAPDVTSHQLEWNLAKGLKRSGGSPSITAKVFGLNFYNFLADNIEVRSDVIRSLTSMDLVIKGGGAAIEQYITIALANTGITSAQEIPVYTNLSEGRGIFTSVVQTTIPDLILTSDSETLLKTLAVTADLNFQ